MGQTIKSTVACIIGLY